MRELLEKAHQQDDDDLFKEEEGDEEFAAPTEVRDVYLDEFADTDDEVDDEEAEEREIRREEKRKVATKFSAVCLANGPGERQRQSRVQPASWSAQTQEEEVNLANTSFCCWSIHLHLHLESSRSNDIAGPNDRSFNHGSVHPGSGAPKAAP